MKSTIFAVFAAAASLSLVSAAPTPGINIPPACAICDVVGGPCLAACIAGGPADPLCDICAGPEIWECITVCRWHDIWPPWIYCNRSYSALLTEHGIAGYLYNVIMEFGGVLASRGGYHRGFLRYGFVEYSRMKGRMFTFQWGTEEIPFTICHVQKSNWGFMPKQL